MSFCLRSCLFRSLWSLWNLHGHFEKLMKTNARASVRVLAGAPHSASLHTSNLLVLSWWVADIVVRVKEFRWQGTLNSWLSKLMKKAFPSFVTFFQSTNLHLLPASITLLLFWVQGSVNFLQDLFAAYLLLEQGVTRLLLQLWAFLQNNLQLI